MSGLIVLFISNVVISNVVLTKFLGMCPLLGVSRKSSSAIGMGLAVILVIAAFVQFVEMFLKKYSPSLYKALGIYLPLITTNCVVLYVTLENITRGFDFVHMLVYSAAVPTGFMLVLYIFSTIRERLDQSNVPAAFKGNPIALIVAALMAAVFTSFAGLV